MGVMPALPCNATNMDIALQRSDEGVLCTQPSHARLRMPALPTEPVFPEPPPYEARDAGAWPLMAGIYAAEVHRYNDGSPLGSSWIVIQYLAELHKTLVDRDMNRLCFVNNLRKWWETRGWLDVIVNTTGATNGGMA